jgi:hypothetical protein
MSANELTAACGLDCGACDILRVTTDAEAAQRVLAWLREREWLREDEGVADIIRRSMYCEGCRSDRELHWSPDCWILNCCVDGKGLEFCCQCDAFPCGPLSEWARGSGRHARALDRLHRMKRDGET